MKKYLLGAAAVFAVAAPMAAHADTNAVVGLDFTSSDYGDSFDSDAYGLNGAFSNDMDNGWTFQMDGATERLDIEGCCYGTGYGAAHLGMRNESHAIAGFVGFENFTGFSGLGYGVEGQMYFGNFNVGASIGHTDFDDVDIEDTHYQLDGAYFFTPDLAVNALVSSTELDFGSGDTDYMSYGVGGEYRFSGSPFSIKANYRQSDTDGGDVDIWSIGFNYDFGAGSLQERSRSGPGLNGFSAMHDGLNSLPPLP